MDDVREKHRVFPLMRLWIEPAAVWVCTELDAAAAASLRGHNPAAHLVEAARRFHEFDGACDMEEAMDAVQRHFRNLSWARHFARCEAP